MYFGHLLQNQSSLGNVDGSSHKHGVLILEHLLYVKPTLFSEHTLGAENSLMMVNRNAPEAELIS